MTRTITRSNSRSGVFNGNYYYTINNSSVTKLCLDVYMPNESGTDYLQGTITLVGNDGTSAPVQIANYSGDSWTLTLQVLDTISIMSCILLALRR